MPLAGGAFLALWNDIARGREPEYDRWHTVEHVPERLAASGFRGARRYVNRARERHRYFTLYEVDDLAAFEHPEYLDLVKNPTPWSASMRPDFANFLRAPCAVAASSGDGIGAAVALLAFRESDVSRDVSGDALALPGVVAVHVGHAAPAAAPAAWAATPGQAAAPRAFDRLLVIEALDRGLADAALAGIRRTAGLDTLPRDFGNDVYDLAFALPGHDAKSRRRHRRAHWGPDPHETAA